jgi:dTDP-L-rhamnose 4-epimerase
MRQKTQSATALFEHRPPIYWPAVQVLITGGAGFIGSHLADALLARGHSVRALDSLDPQVHASGRPAYLDAEVELLVGDVRDRALLARALADVEAADEAYFAPLGAGRAAFLDALSALPSPPPR